MELIKCPECGRTVSDKASNCPDCGYPIYLLVNEAFEKKKCPYCGLLNEHYASQCSGCGAILEHDAKSSIKDNSTPVILPEVEENGMIQCDKCGFSMPTGITICKNCGNRLDNSEEAETPTHNVHDDNSKRYKKEYKKNYIRYIGSASIVLGLFFFTLILTSKGGISNNSRMVGSAWFFLIPGILICLKSKFKQAFLGSVIFYFLGAFYNLLMSAYNFSNFLLCAVSLVFAVILLINLRKQNNIVLRNKGDKLNSYFINIVRWGLAIFVLFGVITYIGYGVRGILASLFFTASAYLISPLSNEFYFNIRPSVKTLAIIIFFFIGIFTAPMLDTNKDRIQKEQIPDLNNMQETLNEYDASEIAQIQNKPLVEENAKDNFTGEKDEIEETAEEKKLRIGGSVSEHIYDTAEELSIKGEAGRKTTFSKCTYDKDKLTYESLYDYIENYVDAAKRTNKYFIVDFGDGTGLWCDGAYGMVDYGTLKNDNIVEHIGYYRVSNGELEYRTVESVVQEKEEMIDDVKDSWKYAGEETGNLYDDVKDDFKEVFGSN